MNRINEIRAESRLIDLTAAQLIEILENVLSGYIKENENNGKHFVYGIQGLAEICNCSLSTAQRIKRSGKYNDAIRQEGRTIIIDADKFMELWGQ